MNDENSNTQTREFEIKIDGHLGNYRTNYFEGMQLKQLPNGETLISGQIEDQAALFGVLIRIRDMGLPLISVNQIRSQKEE